VAFLDEESFPFLADTGHSSNFGKSLADDSWLENKFWGPPAMVSKSDLENGPFTKKQHKKKVSLDPNIVQAYGKCPHLNFNK